MIYEEKRSSFLNSGKKESHQSFKSGQKTIDIRPSSYFEEDADPRILSKDGGSTLKLSTKASGRFKSVSKMSQLEEEKAESIQEEGEPIVEKTEEITSYSPKNNLDMEPIGEEDSRYRYTEYSYTSDLHKEFSNSKVGTLVSNGQLAKGKPIEEEEETLEYIDPE
jgi:hypothetical protein